MYIVYIYIVIHVCKYNIYAVVIILFHMVATLLISSPCFHLVLTRDADCFSEPIHDRCMCVVLPGGTTPGKQKTVV